MELVAQLPVQLKNPGLPSLLSEHVYVYLIQPAPMGGVPGKQFLRWRLAHRSALVVITLGAKEKETDLGRGRN